MLESIWSDRSVLLGTPDSRIIFSIGCSPLMRWKWEIMMRPRDPQDSNTKGCSIFAQSVPSITYRFCYWHIRESIPRWRRNVIPIRRPSHENYVSATSKDIFLKAIQPAENSYTSRGIFQTLENITFRLFWCFWGGIEWIRSKLHQNVLFLLTQQLMLFSDRLCCHYYHHRTYRRHLELKNNLIRL